jgi:hypothetical protein
LISRKFLGFAWPDFGSNIPPTVLNNKLGQRRIQSEFDQMHWQLSWILLGLVGWGLAALAANVLCRMAADQDRVARHCEKKLIPYSDVTVTQYGYS